MFSVHQQTVRLYEKEGLITPKRTAGNTRLFSEEDVDRLEEIIHLTHTLGVNLAGVEMILKLQKKIKKLQDDMNKLFDQTQHQMSDETEKLKTSAREQTSRLVAMKKPSASNRLEVARNSVAQNDDEDEAEDDWKIDYDE